MLRISTLQVENRGINGILEQQYKLSDTQQQLALGKRIITPADDPADASRVLEMKRVVERIGQYEDNITLADNRLQREEVALQGAISALQRVRELAVQGLNDTYGSANRKSIAIEVRQRLDELLDLANSKDGNGEYLFGGFQSDTQPFTGDPNQATGAVFAYQGDQGQRMSQISATREVAISDPGTDAFSFTDTNGNPSSIFATVYNLAVDLEADNPQGDSLTNIDKAMEQVLTVEAKVGSRRNVVESQQIIHEEHTVTLKSSISDLEDLDYASAISDMNLQMTGLQAAQQAYSKVQGLSLFNYI